MEICTKEQCTGCGACQQICSKEAIQLIEDENGFRYPSIDKTLCVNCKRCVGVCPNNTVLNTGKASFFMGTHKDIDVLRNSSSGGAFTALAEYVLRKGGVVFGAAFIPETRQVKHIRVNSVDELNKIRLSKYYQGTTEKTYIEAKKCLRQGLVLFSGTACQIAGLYSYLGGNDSNLLTVDILCHGITSKKVVDKFIASKEKQFNKQVESFRFRLKPNDSEWCSGEGTKMRIDFADGTRIIEPKEKDTFFIGFNQYLFLRDSCYRCKYVGTDRISDFTLADYWGVDLESLSEKEKKYGVSLILANSDEAKQCIEELKRDIDIKSIDSEIAIRYNQALIKPSTDNPNRVEFFAKIDITDFDMLIKRFNKIHFLKVKFKGLIGKRNVERIKKLKKMGLRR